MTQVFDAPDQFAEAALQGFCAANADRVRAVFRAMLAAGGDPAARVQ